MQLKIYSDLIQGTPEWHVLRRGRFTASHATAVMTAGKGLQTYCTQLACEIFTGKGGKPYRNAAMEAGNTMEADTRFAYELHKECEVVQIGFAELSEWVGCSPDGLVGEKGGVELKTREQSADFYSAKHGALVLGEATFESDYINQCHFNMYVLDREWWDLLSYDVSFKEKSLFIQRIYRDEKMIDKIKKGIEIGIEQVRAKLEILQAK